MLLGIDVGNSNIVFAALDGADVQERCRTLTVRDGSADHYEEVLRGFLAETGRPAADFIGAVLSSVVPEVDAALREATRRVLSL